VLEKHRKATLYFPFFCYLSRYSHIKKFIQLQDYLKFTTRIITTKTRMQREKITLRFHGNAEPRRLMLLMCIHSQFTSQLRNQLQRLYLHNMQWFFKHTQSHNLKKKPLTNSLLINNSLFIIVILHMLSWWGNDKQWLNYQLITSFFVIGPYEKIINAEYPLYVPVYKTEQ